MKKHRNSILFFIIIIFGENCLSQSSQNINYTSFLRSVKQGNALAIKAENNIEYAKAQLRAAKGNFDPQLNSYVENKQFNSTNKYTFGLAEIKQPLFSSQYLKMGYQYGQGINLNPEYSTPISGMPYIGVQASLLQGLMIDYRRAEVIKSKYYSEYYTAEQKIQLNDLIYVASNTYIDALYAEKINNIFDYFLTLANQRLTGIKELSAVGERPSIDTVEAAILLQGRLMDKQTSEIETIKRKNELLVFISSKDSKTTETLALTDSLDQIYLVSLRSVQQAIARDAITNPIINQYLAKQKVLETEIRLKREMIKPVLDVSYNFLNTPNTPLIQTMNANNYKWGATFSLPIFLRKSRNEYKMISIVAENNEMETINKQNQLHFKRKNILETVKINAEQIANAEKTVIYSKLLVEAEKIKFTNGESSLFLLNQRENKWLETELKLAEYKLKYIKAFLELIYLDGDLKYEL